MEQMTCYTHKVQEAQFLQGSRHGMKALHVACVVHVGAQMVINESLAYKYIQDGQCSTQYFTNKQGMNVGGEVIIPYSPMRSLSHEEFVSFIYTLYSLQLICVHPCSNISDLGHLQSQLQVTRFFSIHFREHL